MARPDHLRAALFDFDGTLCDTEGLNLARMRSILHDLGADVPADVIESLTGGDDDVMVPPLMERYGATGTYEEYDRIRDNNFPVYATAPLVLEPGARELLEALRARGVRLAVVSMTVSRCVLTALNRLGLTGLFDAVVCGDMVGRRKPNPDPYLAALELLGVSAEEAVVMEDSPTGIAAGRAAGCHVIAYTGCAIKQDVSAADEAVASFGELAL